LVDYSDLIGELRYGPLAPATGISVSLKLATHGRPSGLPVQTAVKTVVVFRRRVDGRQDGSCVARTVGARIGPEKTLSCNAFFDRRPV